mgnify:CR=1 FL=1
MITLTENAKDYLTDMVSNTDGKYAKLSVKGDIVQEILDENIVNTES